MGKLPGKMSANVKEAIRHFLHPFDGRLGLQLRVDTEVHIRFVKLGMLLANENALKEMLDFKGASGIHPCPLCENIVLESSELHLYQPALKPSSSTEVGEWVLQLMRTFVQGFNTSAQKLIAFQRKTLRTQRKNLAGTTIPVVFWQLPMILVSVSQLCCNGITCTPLSSMVFGI